MFQYSTFRAIMAAMTALVLSLWLGPKVITILRRLKAGQPIRQKEEVHKLAELHGSKGGTPTMGGIIIILSVVLSTLLWAKIDNDFVWIALLTMLVLGGLGFADDYVKVTRKKSGGISAMTKLFVQLGWGATVGTYLWRDPDIGPVMSQLMVPFVKEPVIWNMGFMTLFFFELIIVSASNAVNLTDGLDGLAIGCTITVALAFAAFSYVAGNAVFSRHLLIPYVPGSGELAIICTALCGAGMGFLWFNCHPAEVFMGDTGSLAIGGVIGAIAIMVKQELVLILVGGIFVAEALSVILQVGSFKLRGKRIFAMAPLHHHFELKGWSETKVTIRFWILSIVFALIGLSSLKLR